ncbi:MAG TPA: SAM-dependent DNA methyltransferase, partial [Campylobacterales bacterium]|nr:SAM-dependent DNA methyltransferase [Campylobacterales bacterium]
MARQTELTVQSISIENALLAHDYLRKIATLEALYQSEADYEIPKGMKLRDEIGRYWRIASAYWSDFSKLKEHITDDKAISQWLEPLFKEVLGFELTKVGSCHIGDRLFPITHSALDGTVPFVLTSPKDELDKATFKFGDEHRRRSPHALLQEFLNANDDALWGIVSNGLKLRILRDNPSLTRPAFIEIDLERIFTEELYSEFVLFWLLTHYTRFKNGDKAILEVWRNKSEEEGVRALEELRDGVMNALLALGNGFLLHPGNIALRESLQNGTLTVDGFYQQLLRLIYRFLFLFTAEERQLLFDPSAAEEAKKLYTEGYSLSRLRNLALRHTIKDRFDDLYEGQKIVFFALANGEPILGLPALGGLFDASQCEILDNLRLGNYYLLGAIRHLAFFRKGGVLSRINYRDMDTEELGSVYESLLELIPQINHSDPTPFSFMGHSAGSARKLSGSYYTPDVLVQELINSALIPVIEKKLKSTNDPIKALLSIRVIDPASGSGHFLLAAARKIAEYLAPYFSDGEPSQKDYRHALRQVISHCIYGVDLNPLAVELCKTALWLESLEPGRPLGFLDSKIQCGNALVGLYDGTLLKNGIPKEAYKPLTGDDKEVCKALAAKNREHANEIAVDLKYNTQEVWDFNTMPEESVGDIQKKAQAWKRVQEKLQSIRLKEDLYTAAFFAPKNSETESLVPTNRDLRLLIQGHPLDEKQIDFIQNLAKKHRFFHWHIAFADVFSNGGGFDCVLGNPPWDMLQLNPAEFFASRDPEIANARHSSAREKMIIKLKDEHPALYKEYQSAKDTVLRTQSFVHYSGRFPLTSFGRINLAPLFTELASKLKGEKGRVGIIVPSGIATDSFTQAFFRYLIESKLLISLFDFENREGLFPGVHRSYKFSLLTLGQSDQANL